MRCENVCDPVVDGSIMFDISRYLLVDETFDVLYNIPIVHYTVFPVSV